MKLAAIAVVAIAGLILALPSAAQFMYLDSNGDGVNTAEDVLNPNGTPTPVDVYIFTDLNADQSPAYCGSGNGELTINSYVVNLKVVGGTAAFTGFTNRRGEMGTVLVPEKGDSLVTTEWQGGRGGGAVNPPTSVEGLPYRLMSITVTGETGTPNLVIHAQPTLPGYLPQRTSFGTACPGSDADNTYKLGVDWQDVAGCGPPQGNGSLVANVPPDYLASEGEALAIVGTFSSPDPNDSLSISMQGVPAGITAVHGLQVGGTRGVRLYGAVPAASEHLVRWTASNSGGSRTDSTEIRVQPDITTEAALRARILALVTPEYNHGMSRLRARRLGSRALPMLVGMLQDHSMKPSWHKIVSAIGFIGDTAYFDTLHAFVWERFSGQVDEATYAAASQVQVVLNVMATSSPRVLAYLIQGCDPTFWNDLPWHVHFQSRQSLALSMSQLSLQALGYTDSEEAQRFLEGMRQQTLPRPLAGGVRSASEINSKVRERGFVAVWSEEDVRAKRPAGD